MCSITLYIWNNHLVSKWSARYISLSAQENYLWFEERLLFLVLHNSLSAIWIWVYLIQGKSFSLLPQRCSVHCIYLLIFVDDILITGSSPGVVNHVIHQLSQKFSLKNFRSLFSWDRNFNNLTWNSFSSDLFPRWIYFKLIVVQHQYCRILLF